MKRFEEEINYVNFLIEQH